MAARREADDREVGRAPPKVSASDKNDCAVAVTEARLEAKALRAIGEQLCRPFAFVP